MTGESCIISIAGGAKSSSSISMDRDETNIANSASSRRRNRSNSSSKRRPRLSLGEQAAQLLKPTTLGRISSSKPHRFLSIDGKEKEKVIVSHHERQKKKNTAKNAKNERKSSVLKSLAVLDIEDNDADFHTINISTHSRQSTIDSSSSHSAQRRYMRRGSVTRHKIEADMIGMQPSENKCDGGDESDYGSAYDSEHEKEKERRRYLRRGSVTKYSLDYTSIGTSMQPENVASSNEKMLKRGAVVVDKARLPPVPSNDSFRLDDVKDPLGPASRETQSCHIRPHPPAAGSRTIRNKSGRPARRGSMVMPMNDNPRPGDEYWSGNINDSGHERRDMYFDSPEEILSPRRPPTKSIGTDNAYLSDSVHSVASAPSSPVSFHPITPHKPRSGRRICVDEAELFTSEEEPKQADKRETIFQTSFQHVSKQKPNFVRADSGSSFESDESSVASFGGESVEECESKKIPAVQMSKIPRLPPSYSTNPRPFPAGDNDTRKRTPPGGGIARNPRSLEERLSGGTVPSHEDSTVSSNSTEELYPVSADMDGSVPRNVVATPIRQTRSMKRRSSVTKEIFSQKNDQEKKAKGCLVADRKPRADRQRKSVRFSKIVITEFP